MDKMEKLEKSMEFEEFRTYSELGEKEARAIYDRATGHGLVVDRKLALFITASYNQAWVARGEYDIAHPPSNVSE